MHALFDLWPFKSIQGGVFLPHFGLLPFFQDKPFFTGKEYIGELGWMTNIEPLVAMRLDFAQDLGNPKVLNVVKEIDGA